MNRLTIGMPVYNGASTIRTALQSLLDQTFRDFEIIISDNLSNDGTQEICEEFAARDSRVRYVRQPRNLGPQMNFRFVLFEAKTPYFMWAAGDDLWAPTFVERNIEALDNDASLVMSVSRVLFTEKGVPSHMATGTYALLDDPRVAGARFFENPSDNSRYYGVFRTRALQAVFPGRPFFALDWLVSAATLQYGKHNELPETLMIRDSSDPASYGRAVLADHRFFLWRIFPLLFMTRELVKHRSVPYSRRLFFNLFKANLYLHFRFGSRKIDWLAKRYLATNSLRQALGLRRAPRPALARQADPAPEPMPWTVPLPARPTLEGWHAPEPASGTPRLSIVIVADAGVIDAFQGIAVAQRLAAASPVEIVLATSPVVAFHVRAVTSAQRITIAEAGEDASTTCGALMNAGLAAATAERVLILRSAAFYSPEVLTALEEGLDAAPLVAPLILHPDGRLKAAGGIIDPAQGPRNYGDGSEAGASPFAFTRACDFAPVALALRRGLFDATPFSAALRNFDMAVADFCLQVRTSIGEPLYWPAARVVAPTETTQDHPSSWREEWATIAGDHAPLLRQLALLEAAGRPPHDRSRARRMLFIDAVTPAPDQNAGSIEAVSQMKVYGDFGFRVTFIPESNFMHAGRYTEELQAQGVEAIYHPFASSVHEVLEKAQGSFDVVVLSRAYVADRYLAMVREMAPRAKVVFYTVDLHFLREEREAELSGDAAALEAAKVSKATELASVRGVDATIVHSSIEQELLAREVPGARTRLLPLMRAIPETLAAPGPSGRSGILFVGTYQHPPNQDAVVFFAREVWPLARPRLPADARFLIVGSAMTKTVADLAGDGVEVLGFVQDLQPLLDGSRMSVAPLRFGAGLKGKVATTLQAGLPTVASSIATEGVALRDGREILIADTADEIADAVVRLYQDDALWSSLAAEGFAFARREFSFEANVARIAGMLSDIGTSTLESDRILFEKDLEQGDEVFRPSKFWTDLSAQHRSQLTESRLVAFKRTINNCYMQWLPGWFDDPRMTIPWTLMKDQPSLVPIEIAASVQPQPDLARGVVGYGGFSPFANPDYFRFYGFFTGLLWHLMTQYAGDDLFRRLEEPVLGMPIGLSNKGQPISQDLAQSLLEYYRIRGLAGQQQQNWPERPNVLELGAGYGRLAYVLMNAWRCRYIIVDIPPTILVAKWYLPRVMPQLKVFGYRAFRDFEEVREEIEQADLVFLSPNQLALLPDGFAHVSISISSLHEMERSQADRYKALLQAKTASLIYFKQWTNWRNPVDEIEVRATDFLLEAPWRLILDETDRANVEFTEMAWVRDGAP